MDEPFANIDPITANALCKLIRCYKNDNRSVIVSSHDIQYVDKIATHIGIIDNHQIVYDDTIDRFRSGGRLDTAILQYTRFNEKEDVLLTKITQ